MEFGLLCFSARQPSLIIHERWRKERETVEVKHETRVDTVVSCPGFCSGAQEHKQTELSAPKHLKPQFQADFLLIQVILCKVC